VAVANNAARALRTPSRLSLPTSAQAVWIVVAVGILLRLARYLVDRPLWIDESMLSLNVTSKSFSALLGTLDFQQGSPPAFPMSSAAIGRAPSGGEGQGSRATSATMRS